MIVVVGGIKGGSGKSTIATNLVVARSAAGADVLLIDADDQETATDFTNLRTVRLGSAGFTSIRLTGAALRTETLKLAGKYDDVIIDTGGRDTVSQRAALAVADVYLVPFVPRSFDVWTIAQVGDVVGEVRIVNPGLKAYTFINRADPRGIDNDDAAGELGQSEPLEFVDIRIGTRKAFANAAANGKGVGELTPSDMKAAAEISALYGFIWREADTP